MFDMVTPLQDLHLELEKGKLGDLGEGVNAMD